MDIQIEHAAENAGSAFRLRYGPLSLSTRLWGQVSRKCASDDAQHLPHDLRVASKQEPEWARECANSTVYVHHDICSAQPLNPKLLPAPCCRGKAQEGCANRLHAKDDYHTEFHAAKQKQVERKICSIG